MKHKDLERLIDTIFAVKNGDEILCSEYFDQLPRYADLEASGQDAGALLPDVKHHMHQCPECEEVYLGLLDVMAAEKKSGRSK